MQGLLLLMSQFSIIVYNSAITTFMDRCRVGKSKEKQSYGAATECFTICGHTGGSNYIYFNV